MLQGIEDKYLTDTLPTEKKSGGKVTKKLLLLVAIVGVLTAGVYSTLKLQYRDVNSEEVFTPILGASSSQTEIIQNIGKPVGAYVSNNGIILSVDAIIGDNTAVTIAYTLETEDGSPFPWKYEETPYYIGAEVELSENPTEEELEMASFDWFTMGIGGYGQGTLSDNLGGFVHHRILDFDIKDGKVQLIETFYTVEPAKGKKVTATFNDFSYCLFTDTGKNEETLEETGTYWEISTFLEGEWNLEFIIDYGDSSRTIQNLEPFLWEGEEYLITSLVVSPFPLKQKSCPKTKPSHKHNNLMLWDA